MVSWVGQTSGDLQDRANSVNHVDGVWAMAPAGWLCGTVGMGSEKGQWPLPPFSLGEGCPPDLTLIPDTSVSPCMPLVPFKLLPPCWSSEGMSLSKSACHFVKVNCLGLKKFLPPTQSLLVFTARSYGDLSSWHWNSGLGTWFGAGTPHSQDTSWIFIHHMWIWDQLFPHLHLSYRSGWMWFL